MAIPQDQPPLTILMGNSDRARIAETLMTSRRALSFAEVVEQADCTEAETRQTLQLFSMVKLVDEPSFGLYRWQAGSLTGRPFTHLRELLHAKQHPDSWAAAVLDESD